MMRPKILMSSSVPSPAAELVGERCDVEFYRGDGLSTADEITARVGDKDGLLCLVRDRIGRPVIEAGANLKVISTASMGFEHIDVAAATERGVYVGYTPGVLTDATADLAFALLLSAARKIAEADRAIRAGKWTAAWASTAFVGASVRGRTVGIVGFGRIGQAVAARSSGFGMRILYTDANRLPLSREAELGVEFRTLEDLLAESDFVSIHAPSVKETYHLIDERRLRLMKPGAILINTSRGPLVDEEALVGALKEGRIGGAALDVFEKEPLGKDNPLLGLENVTLTPHIGGATGEASRKRAETAAINLLNVLMGERPVSWLNPEAEKVRPLGEMKMI